MDEAALRDQPELMEVAGAALARSIRAETLTRVELWIGPGNNGGDGLVAAKHLLETGHEVSLWMPMGLPKASDSLTAWQRLGIGHDLKIDHPLQGDQPRIIVDCLFGTGLRRALSGDVAMAADATHHLRWPVIACDVPSGLDADTGQVLGPTVRATKTVTFGGYKVGFFGDVATAHHGDIEWVGLGFTDAHRRAAGPPMAWVVEGLPPLPPQPAGGGSKVSQGRVLALVGSPGMEGAAMLALSGLELGGAGLVHLLIPEVERHLLPGVAEEVMVAADETQALAALKRSHCGVAGCGLGRSGDRLLTLKRFLSQGQNLPWVLDADALWHLAETPDLGLPDTCLLTPHEGEALRLLDDPSITGRVQVAQALQARFGCWVLLKGPGNVLAGPDECRVFPGHQRALARAGSGDLLAGMIAAFLGRGMAMTDAVELAIYLQMKGAQNLHSGEEEVVGQRELKVEFAKVWRQLKDADRSS